VLSLKESCVVGLNRPVERRLELAGPAFRQLKKAIAELAVTSPDPVLIRAAYALVQAIAPVSAPMRSTWRFSLLASAPAVSALDTPAAISLETSSRAPWHVQLDAASRLGFEPAISW
jgi:hypothetical protein